MFDTTVVLALAVAVIFYAVSQKQVYDMTNKVLNKEATDELGKPTQKGLIVHAVVAGVLFLVVAKVLPSLMK